MKYALAVYKNRNKYIIDLPEEIVKTKGISGDELKNIDEFTYFYNNEQDLLNELFQLREIQEEFRDGHIDIVKILDNKDNNELIVKREYTGIHTKEDNNFIPFELKNFKDTDENIFELRTYFASLIEDSNFLRAFINTFYYKYKNVSQFFEELNYLYDSLKSNPVYYPSWKIRNKMTSFFDKYRTNYKHLRNLWMFRINYEKSLVNETKKIELEVEEKKRELEHYRELLENEKANFEETSDLESVQSYLEYINNNSEFVYTKGEKK